MTESDSIQSLLSQILKKSFDGVEIDPGELRTDAGRLDFVLRHADRLLHDFTFSFSKENDIFPWVSTLFYDIHNPNDHHRPAGSPFYDPEQLATLSEDDRLLCAALTQLAKLLARLEHMWPFEFSQIGLEEPDMDDPWYGEMIAYTVENKQLVDFVAHTPYRSLAAYVLEVMHSEKLDMTREFNPLLEEILGDTLGAGLDLYLSNEISIEEYINYDLSLLSRIARHEHNAKTLYGMNPYVLGVYDELIGEFEDQFRDDVAKAALKLVQHLHYLLYEKKYEKPIDAKTFVSRYRRYARGVVGKLEDVNAGGGVYYLETLAHIKFKERHA